MPSAAWAEASASRLGLAGFPCRPSSTALARYALGPTPVIPTLALAMCPCSSRETSRYAHHGIAGGRMMELQIRTAGSRTERRHANRGQDFVSLERCREQLHEQVPGGDPPLATGADRFYVCVQSQNRSRPIPGRIGMRDAATDRTPVAHLDVANLGRRLRK